MLSLWTTLREHAPFSLRLQRCGRDARAGRALSKVRGLEASSVAGPGFAKRNGGGVGGPSSLLLGPWSGDLLQGPPSPPHCPLPSGFSFTAWLPEAHMAFLPHALLSVDAASATGAGPVGPRRCLSSERLCSSSAGELPGLRHRLGTGGPLRALGPSSTARGLVP